MVELGFSQPSASCVLQHLPRSLAVQHGKETAGRCLSQGSVAMQRHLTIQFLQKKAFHWGLAFRVRGQDEFIVSELGGAVAGHRQAWPWS